MYLIKGTSNSTKVHLWQNFYNIPTFNMKQLKKAWAKKKCIVVSSGQTKSNNHTNTTLLGFSVRAGKGVYKPLSSNKIT